MLGELTSEQIAQVLRTESVGRIGCYAEGRIYVVPITYAYDAGCIYAHSADGLKIRTMRANPNVCFEVEHVDDCANWRSVITWGRYEELVGADEERASKVLTQRFSSSMSETAQPHFHSDEVPAIRSIFFRIRLDEKTGRFEKR